MVPAVDPRKSEVAAEAGKLVVDVLAPRPAPERHHHPREPRERDRRRSPARAARPTASCTCSPWPRRWGSQLSIDDFDAISERTPLLCELQPGGEYVAPDLYEAGGVPLVCKRLLDAGLLHEDTQTVTGYTIGRDRRGPPRRPRARRSCARSTIRSSPTAAWPSCAATWPRTGAWSSWPATSGASTPDRPGSSRARRRPWPRSPKAASRPATSWSSATRALRVARACGRCSP